MKGIKVIGFDADDTLWSNACFFQEVEQKFCDLLQEYHSQEELARELYQTEMKNMEWYGYGAMAFTLSLIETAIRISNGHVSASIISELLEAGKSILDKPIELFPGVSDILPELSSSYRLVVITKGDLLDQERKLEKSGLLPYFHHVEVVTEKRESNYRQLIELMNIRPHEFLMVGNSLKSDILPVLSIGGFAVHVPFQMEWQHEKTNKPDTPYIEVTSLLDLPAILQG
ncbi:MAG TPA: HAD family hydrolase [Bacteroidales bacterium]|nr:HAD family hydrolase [Bacteroidales bacterium]